jgi:hypothetical protein
MSGGPSMNVILTCMAFAAMVCRIIAKKVKRTGIERHKRFEEMTRKVEVIKWPKAFDRAFKKVASPKRDLSSPTRLRAWPFPTWR